MRGRRIERELVEAGPSSFLMNDAGICEARKKLSVTESYGIYEVGFSIFSLRSENLRTGAAE